MRVHAEISLPYFKQGDDLRFHLDREPTNAEALERHAQQLEHAARILRGVRVIIESRDTVFSADTHFIGVEGPAEVIEALMDRGYASRLPWDDEDIELGDQIDDTGPARSGWDKYL